MSQGYRGYRSSECWAGSRRHYVWNALGMLELLPKPVFGEFFSDVDPAPIGMGARRVGEA